MIKLSSSEPHPYENHSTQLFASKDFRCGDEVLSIAAMTAVQVRMNQATWPLVTHVFTQDVFLIPDGAPGALAELERRKFTAEEGVSIRERLYPIFLGIPTTYIFLRITSLC